MSYTPTWMSLNNACRNEWVAIVYFDKRKKTKSKLKHISTQSGVKKKSWKKSESKSIQPTAFILRGKILSLAEFMCNGKKLLPFTKIWSPTFLFIANSFQRKCLLPFPFANTTHSLLISRLHPFSNGCGFVHPLSNRLKITYIHMWSHFVVKNKAFLSSWSDYFMVDWCDFCAKHVR